MAEELKLYLDDIFDVNCTSPSSVKLTFWNYDGASGKMTKHTLCGLMATEATITTQNKWAPMFPSLASITEFSNLLGEKSIFTWIGASAQAWKGTNPISLPVDFYLINYKEGLKLEEKLEALTNLTALAQTYGNDASQAAQVAVHGGYNVTWAKTNAEFQSIQGSNSEYVNNAKVPLQTYGEKIIKGEKDMPNGTLSLTLGNKASIDGLLVSRLDVTPSIVEVESGKALYYRVGVTLTGTEPLVTGRVKGMYSEK